MSGHAQYLLRLNDNQSACSLWDAITPVVEEPRAREAVLRLLRRFSSCTPKEFCSAGVAALHDFADGDGSSTSAVFTITEPASGPPAVTTFNAMGVLRLRDNEHLQVTLEIGSRFDSEQNQFFLNYLLHRVFAGSFTDPVDVSHSSFWDLLLVLVFRRRLMEAYAQGLFKRYTRIEHNDAHFRGSVNLNGHLRRNVPFMGVAAYTTHEFSHDTPITRLIRSALWRVESNYLATLLVPMGMVHYVYEQGNGVPVFLDGSYRFFPDFQHETQRVVLDAKYKRGPAREDLHQVLAYMYLAGARRGGVILPPDDVAEKAAVRPLAVTRGGSPSRSFWPDDGEAFWHQIVFQKPSSSAHAEGFIRDMQAAEVRLRMEVAACWESVPS